MSQRKKTLVGGVAILGVAGIITKVIGMFFRIPLTNQIGLDGMGVYQTVYPTYTMLLTISTAGIPVAISRMVSERVALRQYREARALLMTALRLLTVIGAALTLILIAISGPLSRWVGDAEAGIGYICIAPSILLVSVMSALRGYMQGRSSMTPTAVSQLIEQVVKVGLSLPLATYGLRFGLAYASAGAFVGVTVSEGLALLFMFIVYSRRRRAIADEAAQDRHEPVSARPLVRQIIRIAVPITIGSMLVPLSGFIDSAMIRQRLYAAGFGAEEARVLYGALSGVAVSLVNVPTVLATAVCISLVPLISAARVGKRLDEMHATSQLGLRLGSLLGMPCAVGMSLLATPILTLLYPKLTTDEIALSSQILSLSALTIFFFTQVQATTGILQGAGLQKVPMYTLVLGVICKVALNYTLIAIPSINIQGGPLASLACYFVSMLVNVVWIVRKTGLSIDWGSALLRPAGATAGMGAAVYLLTQALDMSRRHNALLAVAVGVLVYVVLVFLLGALRRDDLEIIPGGRKLEKLMIKLRVWR